MAETESSSNNQSYCAGHIIIDEARGEVICTLTGEVLGSVIDYKPEWRDFADSLTPTKSRVGNPITNLMHDHGLATYISKKDITKLSFQKRRLHYSMKRHNAASRIRGHKRLVKALQMLKTEGAKLNLPQRTLETAALYLRKVVEKRLGRGEMMKAYIAAALFIASRVTNVPRSFGRIITRLNVKEEKARYAYRKIIDIHGGKIAARVYKPVDYVPMMATQLNLSRETQELMYRLSRAVEKLNLVHGKSPLAIAAAIAYVSSSIMGEKRNQRDIADVVGNFTDVAIRNRYRELIDKLYIEVSL